LISKTRLLLLALLVLSLSSCVEAPDCRETDAIAVDSIDISPKPGELSGYEKLITEQPSFSLLAHDISPDVLLALCMAQLFAESSFRDNAVSRANAKGIAQFRDSTWKQWGNGGDPFNFQDAISAQLRYMAFLYGRFGEIPDQLERYKFALASYNIGRSRVNNALAKARQRCGQPSGLSVWESKGSPPGKWQNWWYTSRVLWETYPYARETVEYVDRVFNYALVYNAGGR